MQDLTLKEQYAKYSSKLFNGFCKQVTRQSKKPQEKTIELRVAITLPKNFKGEYNHTITVANSNWNGMNLKRLRNKLSPIKSYGGMHSKFYKDENGMVRLSRHGKQVLKKRKA